MIPKLFPDGERDFRSQGLGALSDAIACEVTEERNGLYDLTMRYPKDGIHFRDIAPRSIIWAIPSPYRLPQPFRVDKITKPLRGEVTIHANHISYDLSGIPVKPFSAAGAAEALIALKDNAMTDCTFDFYTDMAGTGSVSYTIPYSARQILGGIDGSFLQRFGGEYEFDRYLVRLVARRGANNGVTIRYGKNLTDLTQEIDASGLVTGVCPYWSGSDGDTVYGNVVPIGGDYSYSRVITLDLSDKFEARPTQEELENAAKVYAIANYSAAPSFSCDVNFARIEQSEEYRQYRLLEKCDLCDEITVQYADIGVDMRAKIVKIQTDVLRERYLSVSVGSIRADIAQTIAVQKKETAKIPSITDMERVASSFAKSILGANGGAVRLLDTNGDGKPDELYIADNDDPVKAQKVWRFNYEGLAASKTGYNGPFVLGATLEDGIIADFITVGSLSAALIKLGILQSANGSFRFNLETGDIYIGGYATDNDVNNLASDIATQANELQAVADSITHIKMDTDGLLLQVQNMVANGVDQVVTKTGYRFDAMGLLINKIGEEIASRLDNTGLHVLRGDTAMLQANNNGVITTDLTARNYLKIGHARFEAFGAGQTACFWMQFASGQNILLDSGRTITGSAAAYTPSSPLAEGDTYTISLCVTPAAGVEQFAVYLSGGAAQVAVLPVQGTARQIVRATFAADYTPGKHPDDSAAYADVQISRVPGGAEVGDSTIHWCKVEIGDTPTDWSPAPED